MMQHATGSRDASAAPSSDRPATRRAYAVALTLAALAPVAAFSGSALIVRYYPDRPTPDDLLLRVLPYSPYAQYVADVAAIGMLVLALYYHLRYARELLPRAISIYALMYISRAMLIVLTPLASPHGAAAYGILPTQYGMWPSGHTANVLLGVLLISRDRSPALHRVALGLALAEWISLLLSRGHYTIDIVGGLLLAYFLYFEWTRGSLLNPLKRIVG